MGIDCNSSFLIASVEKELGLSRGLVGTLGVQSITGPDPFATLGFPASESIDISNYEGCTHLFDLNTPGVQATLRERYAVVYNGGTLEHVFDTWSALRNIHEMLAPGGAVFHVGPMNGWVDHGFYQFSPTFFFDYYHANGYETLAAFLLRSEDDDGTVTVHSYVPGMWDNLPSVKVIDGRWILFLVFRKLATSTWERIPQQSLYSRIHGDSALVASAALRYKPPFRLVHGKPIDEPRVTRILPPLSLGTGYEWLAHIPELESLADSQGSWSPLVVYEDGQPLGPPHAPHDTIRTQGAGRYSHWGQWLHMSTSDNQDPTGRLYSYSIPRAAVSTPEVTPTPTTTSEVAGSVTRRWSWWLFRHERSSRG